MICDTCGIRNSEENKFCTNCGEELISVDNDIHNICNECGAENESENKFCISCGYKLKETGNQEKSVQQSHSSNKIKQDKLHPQTNNSGKFTHKRKLQHKKENKNNRNRSFQKPKGMKALWITVG